MITIEISYFTIPIADIVTGAAQLVAGAVAVGIGFGVLGWVALALWSRALSIKMRKAQQPPHVEL